MTDKLINVAILHMRAYEDGLAYPMIVGSDTLLPLKEGMVALAVDIWNSYREGAYMVHNCKDPGDGKYCQNCGIKNDFENCAEEFQDDIVKLQSTTYNDAPYDGATVDNDYLPFTWRFDMPSEEWLPRIQAGTFFNVEEYAEQLITALVEYAFPGTFSKEDVDRARWCCSPHKGEELELSEWVDKYFKKEL